MFSLLVQFKNDHGNLNVAQRYVDSPRLGSWCSTQRLARKEGHLDKDRIRRLDELGFAWDVLDEKWEQMFASLAEFKKQHGHCNLPMNWPQNPSLWPWVSGQRRTWKNGKLSEIRINRLKLLGISLGSYDSAWEEMFSELVYFKRIEGHCNVPTNWPDNPKLGTWVSVQRVRWKGGRLTKDRISRLESLGLVWDTFDATWDEMFTALIDFKKTHGHCNVPQKWSQNMKLGIWVSHQRVSMKKGQLPDERRRRLNDIGFLWDQLEASWEEMCSALTDFRERYGHCEVPMNWSENPRLSRWVSSQRVAKKNEELSENRIKSLEQMGFIWDTVEAVWDEMFSVLVDYKKKYSHCNVKKRERGNLKLGLWASRQRRLKREGLLSDDRIKRLEEIGFQWEIIKRAPDSHSL
jgi:hypothetical protein